MVPQSMFGKIALTAATGLIATGTAAGTAFAAQSAPGDGPYYGKVIAKTGLNVRSGPSTDYGVVDVLKYNKVVKIKCKVRDESVDGNPRWYKLYDGRYIGGFSAARYIVNLGPAPHWCKPSSHEGKYKGRVIAKTGLNVRKAPNTGSPVVDTLPYNAVVHIKCKVDSEPVGNNPRWYKLQDGTYVDGWSAARYISNIGPAPHRC